MGIFSSHLVIGAALFEVVYNTRQDFSISPDFIGSFFDFCQPFLYTMSKENSLRLYPVLGIGTPSLGGVLFYFRNVSIIEILSPIGLFSYYDSCKAFFSH